MGLIKVQNVDLLLSDYIKPICLPGGEEPPIETQCFIAGWGKTENGMPVS